jgi:hypothetical protein
MSVSADLRPQPVLPPNQPGVYYKVCWYACMCPDYWCDDKPRRPDVVLEPIFDVRLGPFLDMKEIHSYTKKHTTRSDLYHQQSDVGNPPLCLTLFSGGKYLGMSIAQKRSYLKKKANDIDREFIYTDNEFSKGRSKLAFEFDLKSDVIVENWKEQFTISATYIAEKIAAAKGQQVTCHLLTRPPTQTKQGQWKYGMHLIFEDVITSVEKGHQLSRRFQTKIPYIDSVYDGEYARLRPAYARKVERGKNSIYLSTAYTYETTVRALDGVQTEVVSVVFYDTYSELLATSIWPDVIS